MGNPSYYRAAEELAEQTGNTILIVSLGENGTSSWVGVNPKNKETHFDPQGLAGEAASFAAAIANMSSE